jgi:hypothetical protein
MQRIEPSFTSAFVESFHRPLFLDQKMIGVKLKINMIISSKLIY